MTKIDDAIAASEEKGRGYVHAEWSQGSNALAVAIGGVSAWQLFGLAESLRMTAERMHISETMQQTEEPKGSGLVAVRGKVPGLKI